MSSCELRQCLVDKEDGKFLFHCWSHVSEIVPPALTVGGHNGGVVADTFAIVEAEDGRVIRVRPEKVRFIHDENRQKSGGLSGRNTTITIDDLHRLHQKCIEWIADKAKEGEDNADLPV